MGRNATFISFFKLTDNAFIFKMTLKSELCRICGCKITEYEKCLKCKLIVATMCKCCQGIEQIQTHSH